MPQGSCSNEGWKTVRALFAMILAYNSPSNVSRIWEEIQEDLIEDLLLVMPVESAISAALQDIDDQLRKLGTNTSRPQTLVNRMN